MSELGKPREFSGRQGGRMRLRESRDVVTVLLALLVLALVLVPVSGCIPTPDTVL